MKRKRTKTIAELYQEAYGKKNKDHIQEKEEVNTYDTDNYDNTYYNCINDDDYVDDDDADCFCD